MWPIPQETFDLAKFTEKILNKKINFSYSDITWEKKIPAVKFVASQI